MKRGPVLAYALWLLTSPVAAQADRIPAATAFKVVPLVSSQAGEAPYYDPNLINPWGLAQGSGPDQPVWAADTGTGLSTVYDQGTGKIHKKIVVTIPDGAPTGTVFAPNIGFPITENGVTANSEFIFNSLAGVISGWSSSVDSKNAVIAVDNSGQGSFYTGLALDPSTGFLFAADIAHNQVQVFDNNWNEVGTFTDPSLPAGFSVFNVAIINGNVFVAFTKKFFFGKKGNGYVDVFSESGTLLQQLIAKGPLNAPWGMTIAPSTFGTFANALLVGNLDDGKINGFDPGTGAFLGTLRNKKGKAIVISGLWALDPVPSGEITFSAGPDFYYDGLLGLIEVAK